MLEGHIHVADGDYVREQVDVFGSEKRLLAWRLRDGKDAVRWEARSGGVAVPTTRAMPGAAVRLFVELRKAGRPGRG